MASAEPSAEFADALSCGVGRQFYICRRNGFKGCCAGDPCIRSGCPDDAIDQQTFFGTISNPPMSLISMRLVYKTTSSVEPRQITTPTSAQTETTVIPAAMSNLEDTTVVQAYSNSDFQRQTSSQSLVQTMTSPIIASDQQLVQIFTSHTFVTHWITVGGGVSSPENVTITVYGSPTASMLQPTSTFASTSLPLPSPDPLLPGEPGFAAKPSDDQMSFASKQKFAIIFGTIGPIIVLGFIGFLIWRLKKVKKRAERRRQREAAEGVARSKDIWARAHGTYSRHHKLLAALSNPSSLVQGCPYLEVAGTLGIGYVVSSSKGLIIFSPQLSDVNQWRRLVWETASNQNTYPIYSIPDDQLNQGRESTFTEEFSVSIAPPGGGGGANQNGHAHQNGHAFSGVRNLATIREQEQGDEIAAQEDSDPTTAEMSGAITDAAEPSDSQDVTSSDVGNLRARSSRRVRITDSVEEAPASSSS